MATNEKSIVKSKFLGRGQAAFKHINEHLHLPKKLNYVYETVLSAKYSLFKQALNIASDDPAPLLELAVTWREGADFQYFARPPSQSTVVAKYRPAWMDPRLGFYDMSEEIGILIAFIDWIEVGAAGWPETDQDDVVVDEIYKYISDSAAGKENSNDFTSDLWPILNKCRSHASLRTCLELLIDAIKNKKMNVFIDDQNRTTLALMMGTALNEFPKYTMEPLFCTQILLEIGFFHMRNQLRFLFASQGMLPSVSDLEPYFAGDDGIDSPSKIRPVFLAFQAVASVKRYVHFTEQTLLPFTRSTLRHFCSTKSPMNDNYVFSFKALDLQPVCFSDGYLTEWKAKLQFYLPSSKKLRLELVFCFNESLQETAKLCQVPESAFEDGDVTTGDTLTSIPEPATGFEAVVGDDTYMRGDAESTANFRAKDEFYCCSTIISHISSN